MWEGLGSSLKHSQHPVQPVLALPSRWDPVGAGSQEQRLGICLWVVAPLLGPTSCCYRLQAASGTSGPVAVKGKDSVTECDLFAGQAVGHTEVRTHGVWVPASPLALPPLCLPVTGCVCVCVCSTPLPGGTSLGPCGCCTCPGYTWLCGTVSAKCSLVPATHVPYHMGHCPPPPPLPPTPGGRLWAPLYGDDPM